MHTLTYNFLFKDFFMLQACNDKMYVDLVSRRWHPIFHLLVLSNRTFLDKILFHAWIYTAIASVRPTETRPYCVKTAKHIELQTFFHRPVALYIGVIRRYDIPTTSLFKHTSSSTARWPLRRATLPDNYRLSQQRGISAGEVYSTIIT